MKQGINKIKNQGENWYQLLQKCQITNVCEKIDQIWVKLSLELNLIETNNFCLQKEMVNKVELGIKRDTMWSENVKKTGVNKTEVPHYLQVWVFLSSPRVLPPSPCVWGMQWMSTAE